MKLKSSTSFLLLIAYEFIVGLVAAWLILDLHFAKVLSQVLVAIGVIFAPLIYMEWAALRQEERWAD